MSKPVKKSTAPCAAPLSNRSEARYAMRVQAIRAKGKNTSFYVYLPMPLAAALGISGGEEVAWEVLSRDELHLIRLAAPPPKVKRRMMKKEGDAKK